MDQNRAQEKTKELIIETKDKIKRVHEVVQELLFSLEMHDQVDWANMVQKFATLSEMFSSLQQFLKKSGIDLEDNLKLLKMTQLVPQMVSLEPDANLQELTVGRLNSFNHNVVPILLRTKLKPDVEEDENNIEKDRNTKQLDVNKQIKSLNSHIDLLNNKLTDFTKYHVKDKQKFQCYSQDETMKLVRAVCLGKGIQPTKMPTPQNVNENLKSATVTAQVKSK